jgi:hypothetical protein
MQYRIGLNSFAGNQKQCLLLFIFYVFHRKSECDEKSVINVINEENLKICADVVHKREVLGG